MPTALAPNDVLNIELACRQIECVRERASERESVSVCVIEGERGRVCDRERQQSTDRLMPTALAPNDVLNIELACHAKESVQYGQPKSSKTGLGIGFRGRQECVYVCVSVVCVCVCVCVCVYTTEREGERDTESRRERECVFVCVSERERERQTGMWEETSGPQASRISGVQGYLPHTKTPSPRTLHKNYV